MEIDKERAIIMLTVDALRASGANVDEGLGRCFNNADFYLRLVRMELADVNFDRLSQAMADGDAQAAFEAAHALKGAVGNLSLTPIYDPLCELTELLRGQSNVEGGQAQLEAVNAALAALRALDA